MDNISHLLNNNAEFSFCSSKCKKKIGKLPDYGNGWEYPEMASDVFDIRRKNLRSLASVIKPAQIADKAGISPGYLSQMIGKTKHRNIGEKMARKIERALGMNEGALDSPHGQAPTPSPYTVDTENVSRAILLVRREVKAAKADISDEAFAEIVALIYEDLQKGLVVEPGRVRALIRLTG